MTTIWHPKTPNPVHDKWPEEKQYNTPKLKMARDESKMVTLWPIIWVKK